MAERGAATIPGATGNGRRPPAAGTDRSTGRTTARTRGRKRERVPGRSRISGRTRARLPELVLGILLVAGGALGAVVWATHEPSQRVMVAARAIQRGESLDGTMVQWADLSGDRITGIHDPAGLEGRIAAVDIAAASPLQDASFRSPTTVGPDQMEYGLALEPGDYPVGLAVGDLVVVVVLPPPDPGGQPAEPATLPSVAEVLVAPAADLAPGERAILNLLMVRSDIETLASAIDVRLGRVGGS